MIPITPQTLPLIGARAFEILLFGTQGLVAHFGILHRTLHGCLAFARYLDAVTPYLVVCAAR
jgi:hypothetical protein